MGIFDKEYEKIKDLTYDPDLKAFTNEDKSIVYRDTPFSDGTGYKRDLYEGDLQGEHSAEHMKLDISGEWTLDTHNEDKSERDSSSGSGCYLTSACMEHYQTTFDDTCEELMVLRWFRDTFVAKEDIDYYYHIAPILVQRIENSPNKESLYSYIYNHVVCACVHAIKEKNYEFAYKRYKDSVLFLEQECVAME